jgi:hypothetical protein
MHSEKLSFGIFDTNLGIDMKPENLLFKTPESTAEIVICDFG